MTLTSRLPVTLDDVQAARARIRPHAHRTPVMTCATLDAMMGAQLFFKCENFQKVGAFKFRGACNAVFSLSEEEASRGVVTHSSGNHAQALALAARLRGIPAYIVMPENAPAVKQAAVRGYGGEVTLCAATLEAREATAVAILERTGATMVHPYNDARIIAGQGTAALELMEDAPKLDAVLAPVGGGGLLSGTAIAVKGISPGTRVIGAEPSGADDAHRSFQSGHLVPSVHPQSVADGLLTSLGTLTFSVIRELVDVIETVDDDAIWRALRLVFERMKIVIEPSAAVPLAALLERRFDARGLRVGIILSGGNMDLARLPR
jgi:threonine dehydratase